MSFLTVGDFIVGHMHTGGVGAHSDRAETTRWEAIQGNESLRTTSDSTSLKNTLGGTPRVFPDGFTLPHSKPRVPYGQCDDRLMYARPPFVPQVTKSWRSREEPEEGTVGERHRAFWTATPSTRVENRRATGR